MTVSCPCCGQPVSDAATLMVSPDGLVVSRFGATANLTPGQAAVFEAIRKKYPAHATTDTILTSLYWRDDEPEWSESVLSVHLHNLRRRLAPLGLSIRNVWHTGYRLVFHDKPVERAAA